MTKTMLVPLAYATTEAHFGGKGANLARLINEGVRTSPGVALGVEVMTTHLELLGLTKRVETFRSALDKADRTNDALRVEAGWLRQTILDSRLAPELMSALEAGLEQGITYAVRSSAPGEDGVETSFAGQFDSVLNCRSLEAVAQAICKVWASLFSERALSYFLHCRCYPQGMAVLIQHQVKAQMSGVMFTCNPVNPTSNELLVEYCAGLGDRLVSGHVSPYRLRIDRQDGSVVDEVSPEEHDIWVTPLLEMSSALRQVASVLEDIFNGPQDVEWSLDSKGQLYVLQARPVTVTSNTSTSVVWTNANIAENFPDPVCPMLLSFVGRGYTAYFRELGLAFGISRKRIEAMREAMDNLVGNHGGRLYYNLSNIHTVLHLAPAGHLLARYFNQFTGAQEFPPPKQIHQSRIGKGLEILWVGLRVIWRYLHVQRGLKVFEQRIDDYARRSAPAVLPRLRLKRLADLLREFLEIRLENWTDAALSDTAAMVCYGLLKTMMRCESDMDANDLLKGLPGLASAKPVEQLWELSRVLRQDAELSVLFTEASAETVLECLQGGKFPKFHAVLNKYFNSWGFRSSGELMLTRPTPLEDPLPVLRLLKTYAALDGDGPVEVSHRQALEREKATRDARRRFSLWRRPLFTLVLWATQGSIRLRERARMKQALLYTRLRHVCLALGKKLMAEGLLNQPDDVLYLYLEEVISLAEGTDENAANARQQVAVRRAEVTANMAWSPPDNFVLPEGEIWRESFESEGKDIEASKLVLDGIGACGGRALGHATVVLDVAEIDRIRKDQILVTRQTDPGWAAVFFMVKGLVIERGGLLSHGAIIAREYGIPAVVGVRDATRLIVDGDLIQVDGDQGRIHFVRD